MSQYEVKTTFRSRDIEADVVDMRRSVYMRQHAQPPGYVTNMLTKIWKHKPTDAQTNKIHTTYTDRPTNK